MPDSTVSQLKTSGRERQIREWGHTIVWGGSLRMDGDDYENAVKLAVVRYVNSLGPDQTDEANGEAAYQEVERALGND